LAAGFSGLKLGRFRVTKSVFAAIFDGKIRARLFNSTNQPPQQDLIFSVIKSKYTFDFSNIVYFGSFLRGYICFVMFTSFFFKNWSD